MKAIPSTYLAVSASLLFLASMTPSLRAADVEGSSDHPLVPRVAGSEILSYDYRQLEQVEIPTGVVERVPDPENSCRSVWAYPQTEAVEGEHWSIVYGLLRAAGAGMMSPATLNRTDGGRELNRRVELVEIVES